MQDVSNTTLINSESVTKDPNEVSGTVNDIKNIEFNSADDVRQTMKAIYTNTPNCNEDNLETLQNKTHVTTLTNRRRGGIEIRESDNCHTKLTNNKKQNASQMVQTTELLSNTRNKISQKRPYRSSKAGPSRKQKKQSPSSIYLGKLSNVTRHRYDSDSDY